jgi:Tol biopolymer transport system component
LTWFDLDGRELSKVGEPANIFTFSLSPDESRAAVTVLSGRGGAAPELWLYELARGVASRFTFAEQGSFFGQWSPDGRQVVVGDYGGGISVKPADGTSEPKKLWTANTNTWPISWSPDGKLVLFRVQDPKSGGLDLWLLPMEGEPKARPLFATAAEETGASISPDGKWMLYVSNESGRRELYVVPFPGPGEKRQVSTGGGTGGEWLGSNAILVSQPPEGKLFAVDLEVRGTSLLVGPPRPLFGGKPAPRGPSQVSTDGKRILFAVPVEEAGSTELRLVSDWTAELAKR